MAPERQEPESSENIAKGLTQKRQQARYTAKGDLKQEEKVTQKRQQSEAISHPSLHRGPPATRARRRPEVALAGVEEQHPHPKCTSLGARDTDA